MFDYLVKNMAPRVVQDALTALAGYLATNGFITGAQEQGFIGAGFFLAMLIVNRLIADKKLATAATNGAETVGATLSITQAKTVAATGKPAT